MLVCLYAAKSGVRFWVKAFHMIAIGIVLGFVAVILALNVIEFGRPD